jgi:diguanylate cyclase (GGDEF)-like protein
MAYDLPAQGGSGQDKAVFAHDPMNEQYDTIYYLVRQTTGASHVTIQFEGAPAADAPANMASIQAPLVHQGRRIGVLKAYAQEFESGAAHLLAGFAVLAAEHHALWSVAHCDMLTKALTRRAFMADLGRAVSTWARSGVACSLAVFDLDHFKKINDTHGHAAGDAVLRAVAHVVQSELRPCDRLGRLGGEEFGVILLAEVEAAMEIAERLRAVIEGTVVRDFPEIGFTASLGVATCAANMETRDSLMSAADSYLYKAKEAGRNCVLGPISMPAEALWD